MFELRLILIALMGLILTGGLSFFVG